MPFTIRLYNIEEGCIMVTFCLASAVANKIFTGEKSFSPSEMERFCSLSVQWLQVDHFMFYFKKSVPVATKKKKSKAKLNVGTPKKLFPLSQLKPSLPPERTVNEVVTIGNDSFQCDPRDLVSESYLGEGDFGIVRKMRHAPTGYIMAVKRVETAADKKKHRDHMTELYEYMRSKRCPFTVAVYGILFHEGDVLICMELMHQSLRQVKELVYDKLRLHIPELVLGKISECTLKALPYLKEELKDVKPSSMLINLAGEIKMCDFGVRGKLVNSFDRRDAECCPYLAPERIDPVKDEKIYDQRSDVWSLGITMYELGVGIFPYAAWKNIFEQLLQVVKGEAPRIPPESHLSDKFVDFVHQCLTHSLDERPKFKDLMEHELIRHMEKQQVDVSKWYADIIERERGLVSKTARVPSNISVPTNV